MAGWLPTKAFFDTLGSVGALRWDSMKLEHDGQEDSSKKTNQVLHVPSSVRKMAVGRRLNSSPFYFLISKAPRTRNLIRLLMKQFLLMSWFT